jgi:poly(beta-D-mannuronate) lyase
LATLVYVVGGGADALIAARARGGNRCCATAIAETGGAERLKVSKPASCGARLAIAIVCLTPIDLPRAVAAEYFVSSAAQINTALQSAQPGDVLTMTAGAWTNQTIEFSGHGTSANPITLRAQTPGSVVLNGSSRLSISGSWLVVDGLRFEGGALTGGRVVEFRGDLGEATNSRITNSAIIDYNPPAITTETDWVTMYGQDNRVDHNYFKGHNHIGQTVEVRHVSGVPDRHRIDSNYFADRMPGDGNGWETIRIGLSGVAQSSSYTVVENNLFERVDGENEAISNKSSHNTFRYNTFRDVGATLTLRHGNDATVEGNFFLGENNSSSGGVRVIGERHKIINNYFANVDDNGGAAVALNRGQVNAEPTGYQHVKDVVIAHNTFVDTRGAMIQFNAGASDRTLLPENVTIANNLFRSNGPAIFTGTEGTGWTWEGNIAHGGSLGSKAGAAGISNVNPQLVQGTDGLWRPGPASPAINAASGNYSGLLSHDMDGQPRIGVYDVGADESSTATIVRRPLVVGDVGPAWLFGAAPSPDSTGCGSAGCAIQAEHFTAVLDPDGDGNKWTPLAVPGALGGKVLAAPAGDRADPPGETHDTIAVYELVFATPGTYTAYYRTRGLNAAANSIYSPDGFNVDPDNVQTLSTDGSFGWVKDVRTFEISASHVGMPLELRLGMREELSQIDALVLSLSSVMTADALDAIFAATPGDYNGDGAVDAADYSIWRDTFGQSGADLPADGDGSGSVDATDYGIWKTNFGTVSGGAGAINNVPEPAMFPLLIAIAIALPFARWQDSNRGA